MLARDSDALSQRIEGEKAERQTTFLLRGEQKLIMLLVLKLHLLLRLLPTLSLICSVRTYKARVHAAKSQQLATHLISKPCYACHSPNFELIVVSHSSQPFT
jgi:hypothetical protein